jgi:hypothetical protein
MSDEAKPLYKWARKRAAGKARRARLIERREAYFGLLMSGCSIEQIAKAMGMSASAVRRAIGQAIDQLRLDRPERYAKIQVARLMKALRSVDARIDEGELKAIDPFLKVVTALDRYHGLAAGPAKLAPSAGGAASPPLTLLQADAAPCDTASPREPAATTLPKSGKVAQRRS